MDTKLTIKQASELTRLSAHTLRYYEKIGLLPPIERGASGYREYSEADLVWIEFLNCLRMTGIPINMMKQYADLRHMGQSTIHERRIILETHRQQVLGKISELESNLSVIEHKINLHKEMEGEDGTG